MPAGSCRFKGGRNAGSAFPVAGRNSIACLLLAVSLWANAGCSWIGVERVPDEWEHSKPLRCTSGRTAPVLDSVGAGLSILLSIAGLATAAGPSSRNVTGDIGGFGPVVQHINRDRALGVGLGALALGTIFTVSAVQGFGWTGECREKTQVRMLSVQANERETAWVITKIRIAENGVDQLGLAVSLFEEGTIRSLIDRGADVNQRDESGRTPLHWAVEEGKLDIVELLASKGADINARDALDMTPLQLARLRTPDKADQIYNVLVKYGNPE